MNTGSWAINSFFFLKKFLIQGFIYDENTGESLPGAHILLQQNHLGAASNESGYYQLLIPEGAQKIVVSFLGYEIATSDLNISAPGQLDFRLKSALELPEIIVREETSTQDSRISSEGEKIPLSKLESFPSIGATMDITRYLQLSPGVQTGGDGFGGLHVRGGNADQNLILLEEIPIYNPFHLFGVSSIFNGDVIQTARFSKSYFSPANDGRLSSVLQITIRDGHRYKTSINASAGLLGTHLVLETPILKNKGTLMLAAQRSHIGNILKKYSSAVKLDAENDGYFKPKFQDFYGKALITLGRSDRLIFNAYTGSDTHLDINRYDFDTSYQDQYRDEYYWGNIAAGVKWIH
ncbi:MAG: carboxypeptidase-like regulatory domain-containing protein [Saprospiraceae bacterium]|nr:carboxypeptidase-like regulatory domain-containing protein [Saprospiraceae bacterium]